MEPIATKFAKRPEQSATSLGKPVKLFSNYYSMKFTSPEIQGISKYHLTFTPEVPDNSIALRKSILKGCRPILQKEFEHYICWGTSLYSWKKVLEPVVAEAEVEGTKYKVETKWTQLVDPKERDYFIFLKIFFNSMMKALRFEQIGPKVFNSKAAHKLEAHKIQVWPGFDARVIQKEQGTMLNIDVAFRVVRNDTALEFINTARETAEKKNLDV